MKLKNITITLIILILFSLNSCSPDKDSETNNDPISLIGKWEFDKTVTNGIEHDDYNSNGCKRNFLEFKTNNICNEGHYDSNCNLKLYPDNYTYENGIINIIHSANDIHEKKVLELTKTTLKTSSYNGRDIQTYKKIEL
jgi:hypothetical protein